MNHNLTVTGSTDINASTEKVWEVLTNPEIIKEYLFGTETITDWKTGSEIIFQGEYGDKKYRDHGVILENVLLEKISYSYWSGFTGLEDKPENYSTVTYTIYRKGGFTTLTWIQKGFTTEEGQQHAHSGMEAFMALIKGIAER